MLRQNEREEIIRLIHNGYDLNLLAFELEISMEELNAYKGQLELRRFVKESIQKGKVQNAIERLINFIHTSRDNVVERQMLAELEAYVNKTNIDEKELQAIEEEKGRIGLTKNIDDILAELKVSIPKRKSSNLRKKENQKSKKQTEIDQEIHEDCEEKKPDYEEMIKKYKSEIERNPQKISNVRNLLAFTYFRAGRIEEARKELISLIEKTSNYTAYRQLIHLEKHEGNMEDAKLWSYEGLDNFPDSIDIREQLIAIAKQEKDDQEIVRQLKEIIALNPENMKHNRRLKLMIEKGQR